MIKNVFITTLFVIASSCLANAQNTNYSSKVQPEQVYISGNIQSKTGDILRFAFIQDNELKVGAYTDSLGNFAMIVSPNSRIKVSCLGFRDTSIKVNSRASFQIVLTPKLQQVAESATPAPADENANINMAAFRDQLTLNATIDVSQGAIYPVVHHKEATQGSRFLYDGWVHGYVINNKDSLVQNPLFLYNYDKIGGNLLLTKDRHAAIELYRSTFKSFTLFDPANQKHTFMLVPDIDKTHFAEILSSGNNFILYKATATKFVASNYVSDGVASSGNNYDEYEDDFTYYLFDVKGGKMQKLALKKKALKLAFADKAAEFSKFINDNPGDIDEPYIANLCDYMNK